MDYVELIPEIRHGCLEYRRCHLLANVIKGTLLLGRVLREIRQHMVKKCLDMLADLAERKDDEHQAVYSLAQGVCVEIQVARELVLRGVLGGSLSRFVVALLV